MDQKDPALSGSNVAAILNAHMCLCACVCVWLCVGGSFENFDCRRNGLETVNFKVQKYLPRDLLTFPLKCPSIILISTKFPEKFVELMLYV